MTEATGAKNIQFCDGFVKDHFAKDCEPFQRPYQFLWTGRQARVGQRTETQVNAGGQWCRLSGVITEVGPLPTMEEYKPSECDGSCGDPDCWDRFSEMCDCDKQAYREKQLQELGALNGQTMTSFAYLNFDFYHILEDSPGALPFEVGRVYKVTHVVDDNKPCAWCVTKIENVTDSIIHIARH